MRGWMDDESRSASAAGPYLFLYIQFEAACFDRAFLLVKMHLTSMVGCNKRQAKPISCAFLKISLPKQKSTGEPSPSGQDRDRRAPSWRRARPSDCWKAHYEGDSLGIPVFSVVGV